MKSVSFALGLGGEAFAVDKPKSFETFHRYNLHVLVRLLENIDIFAYPTKLVEVLSLSSSNNAVSI